jgi:hypothetical protein
MDDAKKEARRKVLAEMAASKRATELAALPTATPTDEPADEHDDEQDDELDWEIDADAEAQSLSTAPMPDPSVDALDSGWGDDDEEEEEEEPELPDERLDPVAYAAAKEAQAERMKARRERRRAKLEAKKARQKARVDAAKVKQKSKSKKARPASTPAAAIKKIKRPRVEAADADASEPIARDEKRSSSITKTKGRALSGKSTWILAIAVLVFVAAAVYAALVSR